MAIHRILLFFLKETLKDMLKYLGNRKINLNRELTKKYQEIIREDIEYVIQFMEEGINKKDAIKLVCKDRKLKKDIVYKQVLDL